MEIDSLQLHEVIREHGEERHRPLPVMSASQWIHYRSVTLDEGKCGDA